MEDEFNVDIAENGLVAYELVKTKGRAYYKAIILDIHMPIMDGIEACNQIYQFITGDCLIANMKVQKKDPNTLAVDTPQNHVHAMRRMSIKEIIMPTKFYAVTGDVSERAVKMIKEQAPQFKGVFEMLTQEIKEIIVKDVKELGSIERLGGTLLQQEEEKQPQVSPRKIENEERPNIDWSNLLI